MEIHSERIDDIRVILDALTLSHEADNSKLVNTFLKENELSGNVFIFILNSYLNMEKKLKQIPNSMI